MKCIVFAAAGLAFALIFSLASTTFAASSPSGSCTITITTSTAVKTLLALKPGDVMCLHGGTYTIGQLVLMGSGTASARITLRGYPGETAILKATGGGGVLRILGAYWTVSNLILDNNNLMEPAVNVTATANHFELLNSEVRNGIWYGVSVFAPYARLEGNTIHYFHPSNQDTSASSERHCIAVLSGASNLIVRANTIYDCWGDGLQMYEPDADLDPAGWAHNVLIENNTFKRGTAFVYAANALDIKGVVAGIIRNNDISGFALPKVTILHLDQAAVVIHHGAQGLLFENNHLHDNWEGLCLNSTGGGQLVGVVVQQNDIRNSVNYGITISGIYGGSSVQNNTLVNNGGHAILVAGQGMVNSRMDHNLIITSAPSLASDATFQDSTIGSNAWYSSDRLDKFVNSADVLGTGDPGTVAGYGQQSAPDVTFTHWLYLPAISQ